MSKSNLRDGHLDSSAMSALIELSNETGGGLLAQMIDSFLEQEVPPSLEKIRAGIVARDSAAVAAGAHKILGTAAMFGASRLVAICTELKTEADEVSHIDPGQLRRLEAEIEEVRVGLASYRYTVDPSDSQDSRSATDGTRTR